MSNDRNKIILVTGGARSGKSTFAERLAMKISDNRKAYIATAQIFDNEMAQRVELHKNRRGEEWITFESPFEAEKIISKIANDFEVILFDCLTIYISNFVCNFESLDDTKKIYSELQSVVEKLIDESKKINGTIIFVTNEVGGGIVPENKLARIFRDCAGIANQMIAKSADKVYLVTAGLAVDIKKLAVNI